jgi:hypothetical protein
MVETYPGWEPGSASGRKQMIDWSSDDWGGGVTYAANGSWVNDKHDDESLAVQD